MTERTPTEQAKYDSLPPVEQRMIDTLDDPDLHIQWSSSLSPGQSLVHTTLSMMKLDVAFPVLVLSESVRKVWEKSVTDDGRDQWPVYLGALPDYPDATGEPLYAPEGE